jgi:hypothetical protein
MSVEILRGLAKTTSFLNVDGVAGVDFDLSAGAAVSGLNEHPVVALNNVGKQFDGTVGADVGLSINAGTATAIPPFFNQGISVRLFSKTFYTFKVRTYAYCNGLTLIWSFLTGNLRETSCETLPFA